MSLLNSVGTFVATIAPGQCTRATEGSLQQEAPSRAGRMVPQLASAMKEFSLHLFPKGIDPG